MTAAFIAPRLYRCGELPLATLGRGTLDEPAGFFLPSALRAVPRPRGAERTHDSQLRRSRPWLSEAPPDRGDDRRFTYGVRCARRGPRGQGGRVRLGDDRGAALDPRDCGGAPRHLADRPLRSM